MRSPHEVFEAHLQENETGTVESDLRQNYADDVVVLTGHGTFHGHDGMRELNRRLQEALPGATYTYETQRVEGELAFLEWTARSEGAVVEDGADSYLIRDGRIVGQTIHYTVKRKR